MELIIDLDVMKFKHIVLIEKRGALSEFLQKSELYSKSESGSFHIRNRNGNHYTVTEVSLSNISPYQ